MIYTETTAPMYTRGTGVAQNSMLLIRRIKNKTEQNRTFIVNSYTVHDHFQKRSIHNEYRQESASTSFYVNIIKIFFRCFKLFTEVVLRSMSILDSKLLASDFIQSTITVKANIGPLKTGTNRYGSNRGY